MRAWLPSLLACMALPIGAPAAPQAQGAPPAVAPAELVIENARIWSDGLAGFAEFAAVSGGRFVHVGERDESQIGPATRRVDAGGGVVIPGLIDAHIHLLSGGLGLSELALRDARDRADFTARVAAHARSLPEGAWILGGRWSTESWADRTQPRRAWVDQAAGAHPLLLKRMDGHSALANGVALALAGIDAAGPADPEGGAIDREPGTGEPTGILRDAAMELVLRLVPAPTLEQQLAALRAAMGEAVRHGITAVCDIPGTPDLAPYEKLAAAVGSPPRPFPVRVFLYPIAEDWSRAAPAARAFRGRAGWVELRGLKTYLDGSLGSRTAYMQAPFLPDAAGRADARGLLREGVADGGLERRMEVAREAGLQPIAHAIGDQANRLLLDAFARTWPDPAALRAARPRSEHAQHLLPEDIARFGRLGAIASMQPYHKADDGRYAESYLGPERCRTSYAFRSLLAAGAVVAFGSDWPVVSLDPFLGIEAAVTGRTLDGRPWQTQECLSVDEALRCYTSRAAYAAFAEDEIGRIAPGLRADFVLLDRSPWEAGVELGRIAPLSVWIEGRPVFPAY